MSNVYVHFSLISFPAPYSVVNLRLESHSLRFREVILREANRRLKDSVIENKEFEALIRQYDGPNAFFYCDPPYFETEGHYEVVFRKEDNVRLRNTLASIEGKFMVSYNDCEYIRELYQDFQIEAVTRIINLTQRYDNGSEFPEVLIANYDIRDRGKVSKKGSLCRQSGDRRNYSQINVLCEELESTEQGTTSRSGACSRHR